MPVRILCGGNVIGELVGPVVYEEGYRMPVRVAKRRGKFRIVEPSGRIAKTPGGAARDGGGHASRAKAQRQANAMNTRGRR